MVERTVVGLIAEGTTNDWGDTPWLSDSIVIVGGNVDVEVGTVESVYLALNTALRNKVFCVIRMSGNDTQNRRMGAGVVTEDGDFVGIGRAFPHTRAVPWQIIQRETSVLSILQTSINNASTSSFPVWTKFFVDGESYAANLMNTSSELLVGNHGLGDVGFRPGVVVQNEVFPLTAGNVDIRDFHAYADRYIYVFDDTIPDGYTAWVVNNVGSRVGAGGVFIDGVAVIDLMAAALTTFPTLWTKVGIYNGAALVDSSDTVRVYGGDVFGSIPIIAVDTPIITISDITQISAQLNGSIFSGGSGVHAASQWQVQLIGGDWSSLVIDTGLDLVNLLIYIATLDASTYYEARVRYEDDIGTLSEYSNPVQFLTLSPVPEITSCDLITPTNTPDSDPESLPIILGEGCGESVFPTIPIDEPDGVIVTFEPCP